jgi:electron transfer flavoprotein beta subunit
VNVVVLLRGWRQSPGAALEKDVLGPHERFALSLARRIRDVFPGARLTAIAAGDEREGEALRAALAAGADRAHRLWDPLLAELDAFGVARALAAAARHVGFDLLVAGARSPDDGLGFVGPAVADLLDIPHLSDIVTLRWNDGQDALVAERRSAGRRYTHTVGLPCLLTACAAPSTGEATREKDGVQAKDRDRNQDQDQAVAEADTEAKAKVDTDGKGKAGAEAKADTDGKGKAGAEAKADTDGKGKADTEAKADTDGKGKADTEAKADTDGKGKAGAEAKAHAELPAPLSLADVDLDEAMLRPRLRLAVEPVAEALPSYETAWVEDAQAIIEHLSELDLITHRARQRQRDDA